MTIEIGKYAATGRIEAIGLKLTPIFCRTSAEFLMALSYCPYAGDVRKPSSKITRQMQALDAAVGLAPQSPK